MSMKRAEGRGGAKKEGSCREEQNETRGGRKNERDDETPFSSLSDPASPVNPWNAANVNRQVPTVVKPGMDIAHIDIVRRKRNLPFIMTFVL